MKNLLLSCNILFLLVTILSCGNKDQTETGKNKTTSIEKKPQDLPVKNIVFFGNSLTAGYGLEDPMDAYPALIQLKIDSAGFPYNVVNAGVSGETSAAGNSRVNWVLHQPVAIFVLELGANDGLRGIPLSETRKNLQSIIDKVKNKFPGASILVTGMQVPPNMGPVYSSGFRSVFRELSMENHTSYLPFLLENVGGVDSLNQRDGIHPNKSGHKIVANNVWQELIKILKKQEHI